MSTFFVKKICEENQAHVSLKNNEHIFLQKKIRLMKQVKLFYLT